MTATEPDMPSLLRQIRDAIHGPASFIDTAEFCLLWGVSRTTFYRRRALGLVGPQPVEKDGYPKWHRVEVDAWFARRDSKGRLHGEKTWPFVWQQAQKKAR